MKTIEITTGRNGYPQELHRGYIDFESMTEAEQFAKENNGTVVALHKRDGWELWESKGRAYEMLTNSADNYGCNFSGWNDTSEWEEHCRGKIQNLIDNEASLEDIQDAIAEMIKVSDKIYEKDDDEIVITCDGRYWDTLPKKSMHIYYDTHTYEIGVEVFGKNEEE